MTEVGEFKNGIYGLHELQYSQVHFDELIDWDCLRLFSAVIGKFWSMMAANFYLRGAVKYNHQEKTIESCKKSKNFNRDAGKNLKILPQKTNIEIDA